MNGVDQRVTFGSGADHGTVSLGMARQDMVRGSTDHHYEWRGSQDYQYRQFLVSGVDHLAVMVNGVDHRTVRGVAWIIRQSFVNHRITMGYGLGHWGSLWISRHS